MISQPKRLRSLTIVPDTLYVMREADRQLDRVIDEMGRPAYVLVARQMGKTNLLLHLKRQREAAGDVACYFDLSTRFSTLQAFFRAIIDASGESLRAYSVLEQIAADRALGMEPNVEFDLHLRLLLEETRPQRLIIMLDEIDSLIGVRYSDKVLAQVRSMYFARENHPIYERLTYVLSGVAEPTDLIKDRNISPFNIGEKIYLENFSLSEVGSLLRKAELQLPPSVVERVYHWTAGNPRMSWDVCAALEDVLRANEMLMPEHVNIAVERVYLRDFDRAPVDHIRTLVRSDLSLRDALMSMHYGKSDTLDDTTRTRLFLAGITRSARSSPDFNNRVIAEALSTSWLNQLSAGSTSQLDVASRLYSERDYSGCVRAFERYLEEEGDQATLDGPQSAQFGIALYHLQRFADAQRRLTEGRVGSGAFEVRAPVLFYLASAKLRSGEIDASIDLFEEVAAQAGEFEVLAKLALAGALITLSARAHADRIIGLTQEITDREGARSDETALEITASAQYNAALAYLAAGNIDRGLAALQQALAIAPPDLVPGIYLKLIDALPAIPEKREALLEIVRSLELNLPMARRYGSTALSFSNFTLGALAAKALQIGDQDAAQRLMSLAKKSMGEPSVGRVAVRILNSAGAETDNSALRPLIEVALATCDADELASADILTLAKAGVISADAKGKRDAFDRYARLVRAHETCFVVEEVDGMICVGQMASGINGPDHFHVQDIMAFFDERKEAFKRAQPFLYLFYLNQKVTYFKFVQQQPTARLLSQEIISLLEEAEFSKSDLIDPALDTFVAQIHTNARATLAVSVPDRYRNVGRNQVVRYRDKRTGQEKIAKFKKVEKDLRVGHLELIQPSPADD